MKRRVSMIGLSAVAVSLIALASLKRPPSILYNPSPSAPIGWYAIEPVDELLVGDLVATWLPKEAETLAAARGYLPANTPVIKTIFAIPGDYFCVYDDTLKIVGQPDRLILSTDSKGREMPALSEGCRSLARSEYLILSDQILSSFDSRYFGPVKPSDIIGTARYFGEVEELDSSEVWETAGARGEGAQGKIKGGGTNPSLSHCLHIYFYGTIAMWVVLEDQLSCNDYGAIQGYQFPDDPDHSRGAKR